MAVGGLGAVPLRHLHGGVGLLGAEGGPGDGGGDPDLHPGHRPRARLPPPLDAARERHHHRASAARRARSSRARSSRCPRSTSCSSTRTPCRPSSSAWPAAASASLFLIPLRRYFVREMHGEFPYPEATAITEVLVTGEKGGSQAKLLLQATGIAGVYDFFVTTFQVWKEYVDFQFVPVVRTLAERAKVVVELRRRGLHPRPRLRDGPALVDDPRARAACLANFVLVPLIWMIGQHLPDMPVYPATDPDRRDDGRRRSSAATCGSSASARSPRPASSASSSRCGSSRARSASRCKAFRAGRGATRASAPTATSRSMAILVGVVVSTARRRRFFGTLGQSLVAVLRRPGPDAGLRVLLRLGGGQRHRHHRAQPGVGHDDADDHHLVGRAAAVRALRARRGCSS